MRDVRTFVSEYTENDEHSIRFDWNGEHSEEFVDRNMEFRGSVREFVLANIATTPIGLVRDLFRAETQCAREAWGIVFGVSQLSEELLRRGGTSYLDDFLEGKFQCFDASLGSAFEVDLPLAERMLREVQRRLRDAPGSARAKLWEAGEELFLNWVKSCQPKAR